MKSNIKVAIAGVGNCASALVQGVTYYSQREEEPTGVAYKSINGYKIQDIKFVAAFDVDARKVGKDLGEAIFAPPNNAYKVTDVGKVGVPVKAGPLLDGIAPELRGNAVPIVEGSLDDVVNELKASDAQILISYLPTGSQKASEAYAEAALKAGAAYINAMPSQIAVSREWQEKFEGAGLPLLGDDIQNQIGATILHKTLVHLLEIRGVKIVDTYQINVGGTPDFLNLSYRKGQKEKTKTEAVKRMAEDQQFDAYISPVAYIPFLKSRKIAHTLIEAQGLAGVPVRMEVMLEVHDPWNNAGITVDVLRLTRLALDREVGGPLYSVTAWAFKNPPVHAPPDVAKAWVDDFIDGKREK
ncbi:myo-inositol-1-phosphate synthase [Thermocladium modestius]|uniref:Myo-inositol-1-phosphate synthase n=1 Tax=Thermocladium modestius TaxID=62609 RepID=A0A830GV92_9CREN|nr:inositol-3-phosphate synthase [Thermocladium modestius]GGP20352.1 myo-inositol-1-phosphate synthase [Thermocladium modestius]